MVLAVLEAHGGTKLGQYDVDLNVAGGLRIMEPAADLAAAAALISSLTVRAGRAMPFISAKSGCRARCARLRIRVWRVKEAAKLGFARVFAPQSPRGGELVNIAMQPIDNVAALVALIAASAVEIKAGRANSGPHWGERTERLGHKVLAAAARGA